MTAITDQVDQDRHDSAKRNYARNNIYSNQRWSLGGGDGGGSPNRFRCKEVVFASSNSAAADARESDNEGLLLAPIPENKRHSAPSFSPSLLAEDESGVEFSYMPASTSSKKSLMTTTASSYQQASGDLESARSNHPSVRSLNDTAQGREHGHDVWPGDPRDAVEEFASARPDRASNEAATDRRSNGNLSGRLTLSNGVLHTRNRQGQTFWPDRRKASDQLLGGGRSRRRRIILWFKRKIKPFWKITVAQILCVVYILVLTFSHPPVGIRDRMTNDIIDPNSADNTHNGLIYVNGSYRPVVAIGFGQKICLAISRISAFSMYPMLVVVFFTKMKALQSFFAKTPLSMYIGMVNEAHDYHVHAGKYIAFDIWAHALFHLVRWWLQGNIKLLWTTATGISGLIAVIVTPFIAFPMMYCKTKISYEVRKGLHYLFYVFAIAMCFHVPMSGIPNGGFIAPVLGSCIVLYALDAMYVFLFMTEKVETTSFHVLSSGVRISMTVSERFRRRAEEAGRSGYAYICLPWIDDSQWHAFSLFEDPSDPSVRQMFLMKVGDWTGSVHAFLARDTTRPCWIEGPFPSPYSHASLYDNQILVASGIGITPALAAINAFKSSRRVNLIWAVRDPEMLEFFLDHMYLDHDGWNLIFYTGKIPLMSSVEGVNTNVQVIKGRPNLGSVVPNVIYGIESGEGLPENYTASSKDDIKRRLVQLVFELDKDLDISATEKVERLREYGEILGFSLHELIDEIHFSCGKERVLESVSVNFSEPLATASEDNAAKLFNSLKSSLVVKRGWGSADLLAAPQSTRSLSSNLWTEVSRVIDERDSGLLLKPAFCPWEENEAQLKCVKRLDYRIVSTWGIMYCGGSKPVIKALRDISIDYNIDLHIDSFAW